MKRHLALLAACLPLLCACSQASVPEQLTLYTDSVLVECGGFTVPGSIACFQTYRLPENTPYHRFFRNEIQGFTFEAGSEYTLLVSVKRIENPPADGSSLEYTLIGVLDQRRP
ncbi:DUF4377 domain-containing protein [Deinococcus aestuarii]|uniref:DUF4377 domain-containing protein n=1 Tax=Deinococcus aestuarii TaxID=2774531 RepID=UPI001C0DD4D2|nr:DUF4377 domain-containing protein [Deinococcus aestuarii]